MGGINGQPQDDRYRNLGGRPINQPQQGGGGSSGNKRGSGFAFLPWWAEIGLLLSVIGALSGRFV